MYVEDNNTRKLIRDVLNGYYTDKEIELKIDLQKCDSCEVWNLKEDLELDKNGDWICESCRNDEEI